MKTIRTNAFTTVIRSAAGLLGLGILLITLIGGAVGSAMATTLTWDSNAVTAPNPSDGPGTWSTASSWWDGSANVTWNSSTPDTAIIGCNQGAAGTITLSGPATAGSITFNAPLSSNYIVTGNTLTLSAPPSTPMPTPRSVRSLRERRGPRRAPAR